LDIYQSKQQGKRLSIFKKRDEKFDVLADFFDEGKQEAHETSIIDIQDINKTMP